MEKMPALFIGHGTPMNAIENNIFSNKWKSLGETLSRPKAILAISAHWYTDEIRVMGAKQPKMLYDMYGFPKKLYEVKYGAPGLPELAEEIKVILKEMNIFKDNNMGFDHGVWSILCHMYPNADIPVVEFSIDKKMSPAEHFETGKKLAKLREEGVMIIGSGNIVHNFEYIDFNMPDGHKESYEFDNYIRNKVVERDFEGILNYKKAGVIAEMAFNTPEHFYPLLYILGTVSDNDNIEVFNESVVMGALSMTGYVFRT